MADQTLAKVVNVRGMLTALRKQGPSTRAELARALSITAPSITRLSADMIKRGLIEEVAAQSKPVGGRELGRPGTAIAIRAEGAYFLGIEIGVQTMRIVVMDLATTVVVKREQIHKSLTPKAVCAAISKEIGRLLEDSRFMGRIDTAVITVPGLVSSQGHIVNLPILGWKNLDLRAQLEKVLPVPFTIENNANAAAFGVSYSHVEYTSDCLLYLKIGVGCGGAAILNGRLFKGANGTGVELGHLKIHHSGYICSCGQQGCLESFVNLSALARNFLGHEQNDTSYLFTLPEIVATEYESKEPAAVEVCQEFAENLGLGLVSLVNIFNPEFILLGGAMRPVAACVIDEISRIVADHIIPGTQIPKLCLSPMSIEDCAVGAACLAHHSAFDVSNIELAPLAKKTAQ